MITKVGTVSLFVNDQDAAKTFYTEMLGMEVREDQAWGEGMRWLSVAPSGAETEVVLYKPDENWQHYAQVVGKSQALTFEVENLRGFVEELKAKGVQIAQDVTTEFWGTYAIILDHENNALIMNDAAAG